MKEDMCEVKPHLRAGRHGNIYVTPDSCEAFPQDFWGVPTEAELADQARLMAAVEPARLTSTLRAIGNESIILAEMLGL